MDNSTSILTRCLETNFWTWSAQDAVSPIPIQKAEGVHFWDVDGKCYLDFNSMVMCVNIGHNHPVVIDRICEQAKHLAFAGPHMATGIRAEVGEKLRQIVPNGITKFLYTLGGADANENAVKLARGHTGKFKILTRYRSYHGATHGAMALSGDHRRLAWEPNLMPGVVHFFGPYRYRSPFHRDQSDVEEQQFTADYLNHLEDVINYEGPNSIAAIMLETVTGTNGIFIPPQGYLEGVRALCDQYGILLITDEVMSGFGRTGKWFAVDHWGVVPDILTMAKGLTSGYAPLGAVGMKPAIAESFGKKIFYGGLTYNGHPISLAAASATIDVMKAGGLPQRSAAMGRVLAKKLEALKAKHPCVGDVRSIGLFGAVELVSDRVKKTPLSPFNQPQSAKMKQIHQMILDRGVFLYTHFNILLIIPPLVISQAALSEGLSIIDEALVIGDN